MVRRQTRKQATINVTNNVILFSECQCDHGIYLLKVFKLHLGVRFNLNDILFSFPFYILDFVSVNIIYV